MYENLSHIILLHFSPGSQYACFSASTGASFSRQPQPCIPRYDVHQCEHASACVWDRARQAERESHRLSCDLDIMWTLRTAVFWSCQWILHHSNVKTWTHERDMQALPHTLKCLVVHNDCFQKYKKKKEKGFLEWRWEFYYKNNAVDT